MIRLLATAGFFLVCGALTAHAQSFETFGTRAAGMGGAFVAVADDASAIYWNPGGLASGAFFSLLVDLSSAKVEPDVPSVGSSRSAWGLALATPPLGLSYYRLRQTSTRHVLPGAEEEGGGNSGQPHDIGVESLITHHVGLTLVQSLADGIAVGATLKLVRGIAASGIAVDTTREQLLDADDLIGHASNTVDADVGMMATFGIVRAGLTVRNVGEPEFEAAGMGPALRLNRQARAGVAFLPLQDWLVAIDFDLTRQPDPLGETRNFAAGLEGRVHSRATVRGGWRFNTLGDTGRRGIVTAGGSVAVFGSTFVDAHFSGGSRDGDRGWGISGRVLF